MANNVKFGLKDAKRQVSGIFFRESYDFYSSAVFKAVETMVAMCMLEKGIEKDIDKRFNIEQREEKYFVYCDGEIYGHVHPRRVNTSSGMNLEIKQNYGSQEDIQKDR